MDVVDVQGNWYNYTFSFNIATPTPTTTVSPYPTATVSPYPTGTLPPIRNGYTRTTFNEVAWDSGARIHGLDIDLKDVQNNSWSNSTADADGSWYIDTIPSDSILTFSHDPNGIWMDMFETFAADSVAGTGKSYDIVMYKNETVPATGYVNFYVTVTDADNNYNGLSTASIVLCSAGVCQPAQHTGSSGTLMFNVTQNTLITATASAPGYLSGTATQNSGTDYTAVMQIDLHRAPTTVTTSATTNPFPTLTITPTGSVHRSQQRRPRNTEDFGGR